MEYFSNIDDPRRDHGTLHRLEDILVLTLCAVICGADSFVAVEAFGRAKQDFLRRFLALPNGIPVMPPIRQTTQMRSSSRREARLRRGLALGVPRPLRARATPRAS
ncbi:MAG: transposase family protein, partial [Chloroflexota bacterium]|nr:transposase family protein [Chloroflexota bacterium]